MASPDRKALSLRKKYANCAARYQKLATTLRIHEQDNDQYFCDVGSKILSPKEYHLIVENDLQTLDSICAYIIELISKTTHLEENVLQLYEGLLQTLEPRHLLITECVINTTPLYRKDGNKPENFRAVGLECLEHSKRMLSIMESVRDNKHLVATAPNKDAAFRNGMISMCEWFESFISALSYELSKPVFNDSKESLIVLCNQLRNHVSHFVIHYQISHDFVRKSLCELDQETTSPTDVSVAPLHSPEKNAFTKHNITKRYADYLNRNRHLLANINSSLFILNEIYEIQANKNNPHKWITTNTICLNEYIENCLVSIADIQLDESALDILEHELLLNEERLMPWVSIAKFRTFPMFSEKDNNPKLNRKYCIAHLVCANELLNRIDTLCSQMGLVPVKLSIEDFKNRLSRLREKIAADIDRVYCEISNPLVTIDRCELIAWNKDLIDATAVYTMEIVSELKYQKDAASLSLPKVITAAANIEKTGALQESREDKFTPLSPIDIIH